MAASASTTMRRAKEYEIADNLLARDKSCADVGRLSETSFLPEAKYVDDQRGEFLTITSAAERTCDAIIGVLSNKCFAVDQSSSGVQGRLFQPDKAQETTVDSRGSSPASKLKMNETARCAPRSVQSLVARTTESRRPTKDVIEL